MQVRRVYILVMSGSRSGGGGVRMGVGSSYDKGGVVVVRVWVFVTAV